MPTTSGDFRVLDGRNLGAVIHDRFGWTLIRDFACDHSPGAEGQASLSFYFHSAADFAIDNDIAADNFHIPADRGIDNDTAACSSQITADSGIFRDVYRAAANYQVAANWLVDPNVPASCVDVFPNLGINADPAACGK